MRKVESSNGQVQNAVSDVPREAIAAETIVKSKRESRSHRNMGTVPVQTNEFKKKELLSLSAVSW